MCVHAVRAASRVKTAFGCFVLFCFFLLGSGLQSTPCVHLVVGALGQDSETGRDHSAKRALSSLPEGSLLLEEALGRLTPFLTTRHYLGTV